MKRQKLHSGWKKEVITLHDFTDGDRDWITSLLPHRKLVAAQKEDNLGFYGERNISSCVYLTTAEFHWDAALIFPREQRVRRVVGAVGIYLGAVMLHCSEGASTGCAKRENMNMRCLHSTLSSPPWPELPLSFPSQWATTPELESAFPI